MTPKPQTVQFRSKVSEAVQIMADKKVGSLVVVDKGKPKGILTERDLLNGVLAVGKDPEATPVSDVMSSSLATIEPEDKLKQAAKIMISKKSRLVILDENRLIGIVTATDIVKAIHKLGASFDIGKTFTKKVLSVGSETSVRDIIGIMSRKRVGSVIVTQDGKPYGIFTERDLIGKVLAPRLSLDQSVGPLATRPLITMQADIDGRRAAAMMVAKGIKRLPLLKGDEIAGIVTARDLVEAFAST